MNVELARRYVETKRKRTDMEVELELVKSELEAVETALLSEMAASGVGKLSVDTDDGSEVTIYSSSTAWPKMKEGVDRQKVIAALSSCEETKDLVGVNYNQQQLAAWCRERLGVERLALPPEIEQVIEMVETQRVGMRSSASPKSISSRAIARQDSNS